MWFISQNVIFQGNTSCGDYVTYSSSGERKILLKETEFCQNMICFLSSFKVLIGLKGMFIEKQWTYFIVEWTMHYM